MNFKYPPLFIVFVLLVLKSSYVLADSTLIFGTPPTQSYETTKKNYQPLVNYLSRVIDKKIIVEPTRSFQEYTRKMKAGFFDIILDGPHFIKYRIDKMKHIVLVKQPGILKFAIIVKRNSQFKRFQDLVNQRVCAPATPHLGTLTFLNLYNNPIRTPQLIPVQSFKQAINCVSSGKAHAAIVRDKYWFKKVANKRDLKIIYITKTKMPARGLTVNTKTVNTLAQRQLIIALTNIKAKQLIKNALSTVGGSKFVVARQSEYSELNELLSMVWGFHI